VLQKQSSEAYSSCASNLVNAIHASRRHAAWGRALRVGALVVGRFVRPLDALDFEQFGD
jgi:hypothetical protein